MTKTRTLLFLLSALLLFAAGSALAESAEEPVIQPILQEEDNISLPEGMDLTQYSYEQLTLLKQAVENRLADLDRQYALENADRQITFAQPEMKVFIHRAVLQNPTVIPLKDTAPARTAFLWSSSNPEVAEVAENGRVSGGARGTAMITAAAKDNPYLTGSYTVQVIIPLDKLSIWGENDTLLLGADPSLAETTLSCMAEPEDAYLPPVTWSSSDPAVASVDANGRVVGWTAGTAVITATVAEDPDLGIRTRQANYTVTVIQPVSSLSLDLQNLVLQAGQTWPLGVTVLPETAGNKTLTWQSSNEESVKVDANGGLTAVSGGEADITVSTRDGSGLTAVCHVTVTQPVTGLTVIDPAETQIRMTVGEVRTVTVQILPENATNKDLVWTSSNVLTARVADGSIEAVGSGDCVITCAALDGSGISTQLQIHVPSFRVEGAAFTVTEKSGLTVPISYSAAIGDLQMEVTGTAFTAKLDENKNLFISPEFAGEGTVILNNPAAPEDKTEIKVTVENSAVYNEISYPLIPYDDIVRNPFGYINLPMSFSGKILRIQESGESEVTVTIGTAGKNYGDQVLWAKIPKAILPEVMNEGDSIMIYGIFQMDQLYSESLQSNTLIPAIIAEKVRINP